MKHYYKYLWDLKEVTISKKTFERKTTKISMGNLFTHKSLKQISKLRVVEQNVSSVDNKMKALQLTDPISNSGSSECMDDSMSDRENLPFQIFCYKQFIKSRNKRPARLYESKLALTEGIIKNHNSEDSLMESDGIKNHSFEEISNSLTESNAVNEISRITGDLQRINGENKKLAEYRKKLIVHLREMEKAKRMKRKLTKLDKFKKTARSSVKIIVGKRKRFAKP